MFEFVFDKLTVEANDPVQYFLNTVAGERVCLNDFLGQSLQLKITQKIACVACGRALKKTYQNGYCFPCATTLARCDLCIVKPERCHFHLGTCREPEWGMAHCMQTHVIYLANTSGLKVGITRLKNMPTRWLDQGAIQALPLFKARSRYIAGLCEVSLAKHMDDKTDWRKLLKGEAEQQDLFQAAKTVCTLAKADLTEITATHGTDAIEALTNSTLQTFQYPVLQYPSKVVALSLEKGAIEGTLLGIKAQYLIFDVGVLNARKWTGWGAIMRRTGL